MFAVNLGSASLTVTPLSQTVIAGAISWTVHNPAAAYTWSISPADCTANSGSGSGDGSTVSATCTVAGNHTLTVSDGTTTVTPAFTVISYAPLIVTPSAVGLYWQTSQVFSASGGVSPYSWSAPGAVVISGTGSTFSTYWVTPGTYTVTLTDSASNTATSTAVVVRPPPSALSGRAIFSGVTQIH